MKAKVWKRGLAASPVTTGTYTLVAVTPTFEPAAGSYVGPQNIGLATTTPGSGAYGYGQAVTLSAPGA